MHAVRLGDRQISNKCTLEVTRAVRKGKERVGSAGKGSPEEVVRDGLSDGVTSECRPDAKERAMQTSAGRVFLTGNSSCKGLEQGTVATRRPVRPEGSEHEWKRRPIVSRELQLLL